MAATEGLVGPSVKLTEQRGKEAEKRGPGRVSEWEKARGHERACLILSIFSYA